MSFVKTLSLSAFCKAHGFDKKSVEQYLIENQYLADKDHIATKGYESGLSYKDSNYGQYIAYSPAMQARLMELKSEFPKSEKQEYRGTLMVPDKIVKGEIIDVPEKLKWEVFNIASLRFETGMFKEYFLEMSQYVSKLNFSIYFFT